MTSRPLLSIVFDRAIVKYVAHGHRVFRTRRHYNIVSRENIEPNNEKNPTICNVTWRTVKPQRRQAADCGTQMAEAIAETGATEEDAADEETGNNKHREPTERRSRETPWK